MPASSSASVRLPTTATHTVAPSTISTPLFERVSATRPHQVGTGSAANVRPHAGSPWCRARAGETWIPEAVSPVRRTAVPRPGTTLASARPSKITDAGTKRRPQLGGEEPRLLPGGEVVALVDLVRARGAPASSRYLLAGLDRSPPSAAC